jgi:hypothetical protein
MPRFKRGIQYAALVVSIDNTGVYWIIRFRG